MKKPIIGLISDTHLRNKNLDIVYDIFKQFIALLVENNIKIAIHLGDWFDSRMSQDLKTLLQVKKIIKLFIQNEIYLINIQGNHDKVDLESIRGYLDIYNGSWVKYFILFSDYGFYDLDKYKIRLHFIPFFYEDDRYISRFRKLHKNINSSYLNVLFTHGTFEGAKRNNGEVVSVDFVDKKYVNRVDKVFVGHYHDRNFIPPNIYYIGSAYQSSFGEDEKKGFTIIYTDLSFKFFKSDFKIYKQYKVHSSDMKLVNEYFNEIKNIDKDKYNIRVTISGSQQELEQVDIVSFQKLGVDVKWVNTQETIIPFDDISESQSIVFSKGELMKYFMEYSKQFELTTEQRNRGLKYFK